MGVVWDSGCGSRKTHVASTRLPVFASLAQTIARCTFDLSSPISFWSVIVISPVRASYAKGTVDPRLRSAMPTERGSMLSALGIRALILVTAGSAGLPGCGVISASCIGFAPRNPRKAAKSI